MDPVATDMSQFFRRGRGQVCGLLAPYVDDYLAYGDGIFKCITEKTRDRIKMKDREYKKCASSVYTLTNINVV